MTGDGVTYAIESVIDMGGFGITYLGRKAGESHSKGCSGASLWLDVDTPVAIKEFYPKDFCLRVNGGIIPDPEIDGADEAHETALGRFRREAERLNFLSCLRAVRGALAAHCRDAESERIRAAIIRSFGEKLGEPISGNIQAARALIDRLPEDMAAAAREALHYAPLPTVHDGFETIGPGPGGNTACYFVMEFLDAGTLKARNRAHRVTHPPVEVMLGDRRFKVTRPWAPASVRRFAISMAQALEELHHGIPGQEVIHCDLKPGNVMFRSSRPDEPVLIDFGLARNTRSDVSVSMVAGTAVYAAIEIDVQGRSYTFGSGGAAKGRRRVGPWTDAYSLGVILRALATGIDGMSFPTAFERQQSRNEGDPDPLASLPPYPSGFPADLASAIDHLLQLKIEDRPQSLTKWRNLLEQQKIAFTSEIISPKDIHSEKPSVSQNDEEEFIKKRAVNPNIVIAVLVAVIVVGFIFTLINVISQYSSDNGGSSDVEAEMTAEATEGTDAAGPQAPAGSELPSPAVGADESVVQQAPGISDLPQLGEARTDNGLKPAQPFLPPPSPQPVQERMPAPAAANLAYPTLGLSVRTITDNGKLAALRMQGTPPNGAVIITGVSIANSKVREGEVLVSSCSGSSVTSALSSADAGRPACLLTESEKQIQFN